MKLKFIIIFLLAFLSMSTYAQSLESDSTLVSDSDSLYADISDEDEEGDLSDVESIDLGSQSLKVKPIAPLINLKMRKYKPDYVLFNSIRDKIEFFSGKISSVRVYNRRKINIKEVLNKKRQ